MSAVVKILSLASNDIDVLIFNISFSPSISIAVFEMVSDNLLILSIKICCEILGLNTTYSSPCR